MKLLHFALALFILMSPALLWAQDQPAEPVAEAEVEAEEVETEEVETEEPVDEAPPEPDPASKKQPVDPALVTIAKLQDSIAKLSRERRTSDGEQRLRLFDEMVDLRNEMHEKFREVGERVDEEPELVKQAKPLIVREARSIRTTIQLTQRENRRLNKRLRRAISLDEIARLEGQVAEQKERVIELLSDSLKIAGYREKYGEDVSGSYEKLDRLLKAEADESVRQLQKLARQIREHKADGPAGDADKDYKRILGLYQRRLEDEAKNLNAVIDMLKARGIEDADYQQVLIESTGQLTTDVLSWDVVSRIMSRFGEKTKAWLYKHGPSMVFKLLLLLLILFIANIVRKLVRTLVRRSVDKTQLSFLARDFIVNFASRSVFFFGALIALSQIGVDMGAFLAGLGIMGFIVGFALQDTLSNFASGLMILIYRPFDVGDLIEVAGAYGRVSNMNLVSTNINTLDNQKLVIPNNKVWQDVIRNVTAPEWRRVDMLFGIGYGDSFEEAETILRQMISENDSIIAKEENEDRAPVVMLHKLGESSLDIVVRVWTPSSTYWDVYWYLTREAKLRFDAAGISIPFPQRDLHIIPPDSTSS